MLCYFYTRDMAWLKGEIMLDIGNVNLCWNHVFVKTYSRHSNLDGKSYQNSNQQLLLAWEGSDHNSCICG